MPMPAPRSTQWEGISIVDVTRYVPAGKYTVVALHRKASPTGVEKEVEVKDADAPADFTMEVK